MKKEYRNLLKTIISQQELIMKALNISFPVKKIEEKATIIKQSVLKKGPVKKITTKPVVKKALVKTVKK